MKIQITYDREKHRFVIRCPFHANELVMDIPSRRWHKASRSWLAPALRQNVAYIQEVLRPLADIDDRAEEAIAGYLAEAVMPGKNGFPSWYPYKTKPMKHQSRNANYLYGLKAMGVFNDMGTGKTKLAIDLACAMRMEGKINTVLVLCKYTLRKNWEAEWQKHAAIPYSLFLPESPQGKRYAQWMKQDHDFRVMVMGIESFSQGSAIELADRFLLSTTTALTVIDESQYISNPKAVRSERIVSLGRKSEYRIAMTGTPIDKGPMNLYMQFEFLDPDIIGIGDYYAFRNRYAVMGGFRVNGKPTQIVAYQHLDELINVVSPFVVQVRKSEVLDLIPKGYERRVLVMHPKQRELYRSMRKEKAYEWKGQQVTLKNVLELYLRLHQICGGHTVTKYKEPKIDKKTGDEIEITKSEYHQIVTQDENPKIQEILSILGETDEQAVIWCVYNPEIDEVVDAIQKKFPDRVVGQLRGGSTETYRDEMVQAFQRGEVNYIVGNQKTGGTGYNMFASQLCIYYNNTFSMRDRMQSEDRLHRHGQTGAVKYIDLIMEKSIDEVILDAIAEKMDVSEFIRGKLDLVLQDLD